MGGYVIHRPDPAAMERVLAEHDGNAAGTIVRLAWQAGLLREEIHTLTWDQTDLFSGELRLPDRTVPLPGALADYLSSLRQRQARAGETVVLSDRDQRPLNPQSISRLARRALDGAGETEVRLIDLRHDFVIRQLQAHDWQYVSRITGVEAPALWAHFAGWMGEKPLSTRAARTPAAPLDELALWKLLRTEGGGPAVTALWLTWQVGLRVEEIAALRWDQVEETALRLPDRRVPLTAGAAALLRELRAASDPLAEYVLTAPRTGRPYDRARISRMARTALVNAGLDDLTLRDLRLDHDLRSGGGRAVADYLRSHGSITRNEAAVLLGVPPASAYQCLKRLVRRGKLTQVGARYYLPAAVVPPERQAEVILAYLAREGFAYRQDIARILKIAPRQCQPVLRRLVAAGDIVQQRQRYSLPRRAAGEG